MYLSQVGVCYFYQKEYEKAIEYYTSAMENGFSEDFSDDNIWEATEIIYKLNSDRKIIDEYLKKFPNGMHAKKANSILK